MGASQYIILANLCIAVLLGFYLIFLKKETFFQLNRVYLLGSLLISFIIPNMQINWAEQLNITRQIKYTIQAEPVTIFSNSPIAENHFTFGQVILFIYLAGVVILSIHLLIKLLSVRRMLQSTDNPLSYSFFKRIYLSEQAVDPLICEH